MCRAAKLLLLLESQNNFSNRARRAVGRFLGYQDEQNFDLERPAETMQPPAPEVEPLIMQALQQRPELQSLQFQIRVGPRKTMPPSTTFGDRP